MAFSKINYRIFFGNVSYIDITHFSIIFLKLEQQSPIFGALFSVFYKAKNARVCNKAVDVLQQTCYQQACSRVSPYHYAVNLCGGHPWLY